MALLARLHELKRQLLAPLLDKAPQSQPGVTLVPTDALLFSHYPVIVRCRCAGLYNLTSPGVYILREDPLLSKSPQATSHVVHKTGFIRRVRVFPADSKLITDKPGPGGRLYIQGRLGVYEHTINDLDILVGNEPECTAKLDSDSLKRA